MITLIKSQSAFTLAEVLTVIAVLAIITTISVPFLRNMSLNGSLNSATKELASDLRLTQQLSVTSQDNHQLILNIADNSYLIRNKEEQSTIKFNKLKEPVFLLSVTSPDGQTIEFNSTGAVTDEGIIILSNDTLEKTIEIKPSGYVKIQ